MTNKQDYAGLLERLVRNTKDTTAFCPEPIYRNPDGPEAAEAISSLLKALEGVLPRNICLTNRNIPDDTVVPLECTMGDLRRIDAALNSDAPLSIGEEQ